MNRKKAPPRALLTLIFTIVVFIILQVELRNATEGVHKKNS